MAGSKGDAHKFSRRSFLRGMRWTPLLFLPAPLHGSPSSLTWHGFQNALRPAFPLADLRLTPHYPAKSPLEDVLRLVTPGRDEFTTEKYAFEITPLLEQWSRALRSQPPGLRVLGALLDASFTGGSLKPAREAKVRSGYGIEVWRRQFADGVVPGAEQFQQGMRDYLADFSALETAQFEIVAIEEVAGTRAVRAEIRYDLAGKRRDGNREERIGHWRTEWVRGESSTWRISRWEATEETVSRASGPVFEDVTSVALGDVHSYREQMLHGVDYWRTVLDGACGIDVYGNNGLAAGDYDNDGFDDLYVCQPAGLPNRLYRNRGDGTFEDVSEKSGVDVLDGTACALFADFENKGLQDLLVVCGTGPLLFLNQGNGKFALKPDAFKFAQPPQGTFTHAAIADYDGDGRLDIYFCLYSYYVGLDQYHYPVPYFDARNGPPNFLLHNEGGAFFQDRTLEAGLMADNDRFSFACAWGDYDSDGFPDVYVVNDFGRSNLYRNNGDGTFKVVSNQAGVEDVGAGMSACWLDFDGDGRQDLYASNMWSAAGLRVSQQKNFHPGAPEEIRALYRRHARGNSLYKNLGNGKFENVSERAGVELGRWAWASDAWDFDQDGYADLYVANGYISGAEPGDLSSFFWRQVVGKSPENSTPSLSYEHGWNALNELIRSDSSWSGYERNVLFANNRDGTFTDISGITGLDFPEDSRSFVLADLDGDGRLEVVLKNRNAPQLRILRNAMKEAGQAISFRLRGGKSNRDAIGAAVTVEAGGRRQTKYVQAGSGFLAQHTKELFFGLGQAAGEVRASIRWPSGLVQQLEHLPVGRRIEVEEGRAEFSAKPFAAPAASWVRSGEGAKLNDDAIRKTEALPQSAETWLIDPLSAPEFALADVGGNLQQLRSFRGSVVLLTFWESGSAASVDQLRLLQRSQHQFTAQGLRVLSINADDPMDAAAVRSLVSGEGIGFPVLLATPEIAGIYNVIYRYLFDRRRDLDLPTSFLLDKDGMIVKVYQGPATAKQVLEDAAPLPTTQAERMRKAFPLGGRLFQDAFQRNDFTYGVALFQRGYLEQAAASFRQVIAAKPDDPEAYYNLGTLELRRHSLDDARRYLEQAVKLRPNYPEAWNNLGMIAAQQGHADEAVSNFQKSLEQRPTYATALLNLGNLYRRQGKVEEAQQLLLRALEVQPDDPEVNYGLGMFYATQEQFPQAQQYLEKAVELRPDYPEALNNLGVLLIREQHYPEAEEKFRTCIRQSPNFDQAYLNLARLYVIQQEKDKAKEVLLDLLRLQPQHQVARQTLEMLQ